jgi:hypothetical protein
MTPAGPGTLLGGLFNLEPGEGPRLAYLWLLYLLFTAAMQVGDGVNQTLFLKRVGVQYLPIMFAVKACLDLGVAFIYVPLAARIGHRWTLTLALVLGCLGTAILWLPASMGHPFTYPLLYGFIESLGTLLKIHWGVLLLDCFTREASRRTFPLVYTGSRLGAIVGGGVLTGLARRLGAPRLLLVSSNLFFGAAALSFGLGRLMRGAPGAVPGDDPIEARESAAGRIVHVRRGISLGFRLPLLRAIAISTALMVLCRYGLRYRYSAAFAEAFQEAELAAFYGFYMVLANTGSIVVQSVVTSRLLVRAGITTTNLIYAICILAVYLGLGVWPGLLAAVLARLIESELKAAIKTPLSNLFYGAIPAGQRAAGRAFNLGLVVPISTVVTSLVLATPTGISAIPWWGTVLAVLYVAATLFQNRSYVTTLAAAQRE